jgi:hypothetical protein
MFFFDNGFLNIAQGTPETCLINKPLIKKLHRISAKNTKYLVRIINMSFHHKEWYEKYIYS